MAQVFRLANKTQTSTYNFLTGNLKPADMIRTPNGDGWYTTTMTLVARTTDANIISAVNTIDELAEANALFWEDQHRTESIWLEESATDETTKRSLIQSIELTPLQVGWFSTMLNKTGALYSLTIIHSAAWENVTGGSVVTTDVGPLGELITLPAIDGSLPGRIWDMNITGDADTTGTLTTFWGGIHSTQGTTGTSDFNAIIELEKGTLGSTDVALGSDSDDASPYGTTDNIITYTATTDDFQVVAVSMDQAFTSTAYDHWIGDYLVLLRAKLSAESAVKLHLDVGYTAGAAHVGPNVYTSSTAYIMLEMGTISLPPFPRDRTALLLGDLEFRLYLQRIGGVSTVLTADCLVLIPSEHAFKITSASIPNANTFGVKCYQYEDGLIAAQNLHSDGYVNISAYYSPTNFVYPVAGGSLIVVGQETAGHHMVNDIGVSVYYYERFRTHGE